MSESRARRNVSILFDDNRLNAKTALLEKLAQMQHADGSWPWFPVAGDDYITLYISGHGRMRHLGVKVDTAPAVKSLSRLDGWMHQLLDAQKHHGR